MVTAVLVIVALLCIAASTSWIRSAFFSYRHWQNAKRRAARAGENSAGENEAGEAEELDEESVGASRAASTSSENESIKLARYEFLKSIQAAFLYLSLGIAFFVAAGTSGNGWDILYIFVLPPAIVSIYWSTKTKEESSLKERRISRDIRAAETLVQDQLAPRAWADRLAPEDLPEFEGLEVAKIYQAGSGLIAGDFYDLFRVSDHRLAAVIGDVAGKDIDSSITAFQAKYLLRVFLRQFRDPAQALEELNRQMAVYAKEDFISTVVLLFDSEAGTLRYASAGHPTVWLWHNREVHPMKTTGSLVMIDPESTFFSREINVEAGDVVLMYTDGISEVRNVDGEQLGEEQIGNLLRRDPNVSVDVMCKQILDTAIAYSEGPVIDDMAMIGIRLTRSWGENNTNGSSG